MRHTEISGRFNTAFAHSHRTVLIGGAKEPLYLPARGHRPAVIRYTQDYAQSALHELAHWCLAGAKRRARLDYDYWYQPPPREPLQQRRFEAVETPVQGLELVMALATGVRFHISFDNPGRPAGDCAGFRRQVTESALRYVSGGMSQRTRAVLDALNVRWADRTETLLTAFAGSASDVDERWAERETNPGKARG